MFCCALLCVDSNFSIISMGKREIVALLCFSSWYLVIVVCLFLAMPRVCLQFVIVVFPDRNYLPFLKTIFCRFESGRFTQVLLYIKTRWGVALGSK